MFRYFCHIDASVVFQTKINIYISLADEIINNPESEDDVPDEDQYLM